jgi:hypothetical protein
MDRLLGVTWLSLGPLQLETPTYFLLEREAPLSYVPPDAVAASRGPMFAFERRWAELLFIATLGGDAPTSFVGLWEKLGRDAPPYFAPGLRAAVYALTFGCPSSGGRSLRSTQVLSARASLALLDAGW